MWAQRPHQAGQTSVLPTSVSRNLLAPAERASLPQSETGGDSRNVQSPPQTPVLETAPNTNHVAFQRRPDGSGEDKRGCGWGMGNSTAEVCTILSTFHVSPILHSEKFKKKSFNLFPERKI